MHRLSLIITLFLLWNQATMAQLSYEDVRYEAIPFRTVKTYLDSQREKAQVDCFADLRPTCENIEDFSAFYRYRRQYSFKQPIEQVWEAYRKANPTEAWTTKKSSCGLMYERESDRIIYPADSVDGIMNGQILYMDIKLIRGLYHLATAFEITKVEDELGIIEVNYTESGINEGKQIIQMFETENGRTRIVHTTFIRSGNKIRDKYLYPYFHTRLINSFHRKMKRLIARSES